MRTDDPKADSPLDSLKRESMAKVDPGFPNGFGPFDLFDVEGGLCPF
jgi:hypothetical protein